MSVAVFCPSQLYVILTKMALTVSTLQGTLIKVPAQPDTLVYALKMKCIEASPFHMETSSALQTNADLAHVMRNSKPTECIRDVRLSTWDGKLLNDEELIGSQVDTLDVLFKMVFMQQYNLSNEEWPMLREFADYEKRTAALVVTAPIHQTQFVARPVFGGEDRPNAILGIIYNHFETETHCQLMERDVHPKDVHSCQATLMINVEAPAMEVNDEQ